MGIIKGSLSIIHSLVGINTSNSTQALSAGKGKDLEQRIEIYESQFLNKGYLQKRQTVCTSPVASGLPSFLTGTGSANLSLQNVTSSAPLIGTAAAGFGENGAIDYIDKITTNLSNQWTAGSSSTTYFLYRDFNGTSWSSGKTALEPVYDQYAPSAPASGQYWFDINRYVGFEWDGSSWIQKIRYFLGEAVWDNGGGTWTSVIHYALNGRYVGPETAIPGVGTQTPWNHNIGTNKIDADVVFINKTAEFNYSVGDIFKGGVENYGVNNAIVSGNSVATSRLSMSRVRAAAGTEIINKTSGLIGNLTPANWRYIPIAERKF